MIGSLAPVITRCGGIAVAIARHRDPHTGIGVRVLSNNGRGDYNGVMAEKDVPLIHTWSDEFHQVPQSLFSTDGQKMVECVAANDSRPNYPTFSTSVFTHELERRSCLYGKPLLAAHSLSSTQPEEEGAQGKAYDFLPGTVLVADTQTAGRGRGKNQWSSPEGCLMFSYVVKHNDGQTLPLLQYIVSMAIVEAVTSLSAMHRGKVGVQGHIRLKLKWPNDIYSESLQKIGGILCESRYLAAKGFYVIIGVGLNVQNEQPTVGLSQLARIANIDPSHFSREIVLAEFFKQFQELMSLFSEVGFVPFRERYLTMWLHSGQKVRATDTDILGENGQAATSTLTIQGLTDSGYLLALDEGGTCFELKPDGTSLDFFGNLVKKKL